MMRCDNGETVAVVESKSYGEMACKALCRSLNQKPVYVNHTGGANRVRLRT